MGQLFHNANMPGAAILKTTGSFPTDDVPAHERIRAVFLKILQDQTPDKFFSPVNRCRAEASLSYTYLRTDGYAKQHAVPKAFARYWLSAGFTVSQSRVRELSNFASTLTRAYVKRVISFISEYLNLLRIFLTSIDQ